MGEGGAGDHIPGIWVSWVPTPGSESGEECTILSSFSRHAPGGGLPVAAEATPGHPAGPVLQIHT